MSDPTPTRMMAGDRVRIEMGYDGAWCHVLYCHARRQDFVLPRTFATYSAAVSATLTVVNQLAGRRS